MGAAVAYGDFTERPRIGLVGIDDRELDVVRPVEVAVRVDNPGPGRRRKTGTANDPPRTREVRGAAAR